MCIILLNVINGLDQVITVLKMIALSGIFVSMYGIAQYMGFDFVNLAAKGFPVSTFGNVNFASEFLVMAIPLATVLFLTEKNRFQSSIWGLSFTVMTIHLILTLCKGGWLSLFISFLSAVLGFLFVIRKSHPSPERLINLTKVCILAASLIVILTPVALSGKFSHLKQKVSEEIQSGVRPGFMYNRLRLNTWKNSTTMMLKNPLGTGIGNFKFTYPGFTSFDEFKLNKDYFRSIYHLSGSDSTMLSKIPIPQHVENDAIEILVETGIPGLVSFAVFVAMIIGRLVFLTRRSRDRSTAIVSAGLMCAVVSFIVHGFFSFPFYNIVPSFLLWSVGGITLALSRLHKGEKPIAIDLSGRFWRTPQTVIVVACVAVVLEALVIRSFAASVLVQKGNVLLSSRRVEDAISTLRTAIRFQAHDIEAHRSLGTALSASGKHEEAINEYEKVLKLSPYDSSVRNTLGNTYSKIGRFDIAQKQYETILGYNPYLTEVRANLGVLYTRQEKYDEAVGEFRRAVEMDPDFPELHYNLGYTLFLKGMYQEALSEMASTIELRPQFAPAYETAGVILEKIGKYDEAIKFLQAALQLKPSAWLHNEIAVIHARSGRISEAKEELKKALALDPDFADAAENLKKLEEID
jgi:tetratricopeptide (TPR) repeat protein/O-antigen ligase